MTTVRSHFGLPVSATDVGDAAARWYHDLTGSPGRLVVMNDSVGWRLPDDLDVFGQSAPFSDAAPVLVASQSSVDWLRERASEDFGIDRFRANLVVVGAAPWEEDSWTWFDIGSASLRNAVPWPRCQIPQVDQVTSERHREPARALRAHRWCTDAPGIDGPFREIVEGNALFGVGCSIEAEGADLRVGDEVVVRSTARPVLAMEAG